GAPLLQRRLVAPALAAASASGPLSTELARHLGPAGLRHGLEHPRALRVVALGEGALLQALRHPPRADGDRHRAARRPQDAQHLELDVLELGAPLKAVEDQP